MRIGGVRLPRESRNAAPPSRRLEYQFGLVRHDRGGLPPRDDRRGTRVCRVQAGRIRTRQSRGFGRGRCFCASIGSAVAERRLFDRNLSLVLTGLDRAGDVTSICFRAGDGRYAVGNGGTEHYGLAGCAHRTNISHSDRLGAFVDDRPSASPPPANRSNNPHWGPSKHIRHASGLRRSSFSPLPRIFSHRVCTACSHRAGGSPTGHDEDAACRHCG